MTKKGTCLMTRRKKSETEVMELTFFRDLDGWGGEAKLWGCSHWYASKNFGGPLWFVVSCCIHQGTTQRTLLFAVDEEVETVDWDPLDGSLDDVVDHELAIAEFVRLQTTAIANLSPDLRGRYYPKPPILARGPITLPPREPGVRWATSSRPAAVGVGLALSGASYQQLPYCRHILSIKRPRTFAERPKWPKEAQMYPAGPGAPYGHTYEPIEKCLLCGYRPSNKTEIIAVFPPPKWGWLKKYFVRR
jgi:hypothetical protein